MRSSLPVVFALLFACGKGGSDGAAAAGTERGGCRPDRACDPGLQCMSNLCVRPPGADCKAVGEAVTSLDLGNYAEPEDRAPVVAKYQAACEGARISKAEGTCLEGARDKWVASQCAPRMFPELASSNTSNCG